MVARLSSSLPVFAFILVDYSTKFNTHLASGYFVPLDCSLTACVQFVFGWGVHWMLWCLHDFTSAFHEKNIKRYPSKICNVLKGITTKVRGVSVLIGRAVTYAYILFKCIDFY